MAGQQQGLLDVEQRRFWSDEQRRFWIAEQRRFWIAEQSRFWSAEQSRFWSAEQSRFWSDEQCRFWSDEQRRFWWSLCGAELQRRGLCGTGLWCTGRQGGHLDTLVTLGVTTPSPGGLGLREHRVWTGRFKAHEPQPNRWGWLVASRLEANIRPRSSRHERRLRCRTKWSDRFRLVGYHTC